MVLGRALPLGWLQGRAARLRKRAEAEQDVADAEALLAEVRKRATIQHLEVQFSTEEVLDVLRHDRRLAKSARDKEFAVAVDAFYRDHLRTRDGQLTMLAGGWLTQKPSPETDTPLEMILATVVLLGFLVLVYFLWQ